MRVNRIPQAVRKRNIQELIEEHHAKTRPAPAPPVPAAATTTIVPNKPRQAPIVQSTRKRKR
jgi:ribosomal protein L12E/L44/L45/RPP1/RPP2